MPAVKNPPELLSRLELSEPDRLLLVDVPAEFVTLLSDHRPGRPPYVTAGERVRPVKESFDAILVWREDRAGSRAVLDALVKRLAPGGALWVVTAMKKVTGPRTPAARRLERSDLVTAFSKEGLHHDREVRITSWHIAHRFMRNAGPR